MFIAIILKMKLLIHYHRILFNEHIWHSVTDLCVLNSLHNTHNFYDINYILIVNIADSY